MAAEITRWRPFRELDRMRKEMDRLWDSFLEEGRSRRGELTGEWVPALDLSELEDRYVVKAEIPGVDPKKIDISLSDGVLTIKGEKSQEKEKKEENYHFVERSYGSFMRSVRLPAQIQGDKITASYKDGVLKIDLPKSEEAKSKEIRINVET